MKKRNQALLLAAAVSVSFLMGGCGNSQTGTETKTPETKAAETQTAEAAAGTAAAQGEGAAGEETKPAEAAGTTQISYPVESKGEKLTVWCPIQPPAAKYITSYNDQEVYQEISKRTGIEVEYIHPAIGQEREQLSLLIASGELPDIIQIRGFYPGGSTAGVEEGVFLDLTDMMPEYAPDYYKLITDSEMAYRLATNNDSRILDFDIIKQTAPAFERVNFLNIILEKYGITELPVTIDDYETIFAKFQADGLPGFAPVANGQVEQFMWPYGIAPGFFLGEDGEVRWGAATKEYKDYLTLMNHWYESGYLYKDFMSNITTNERRALFSNAQVGMLIDATDLAYSMATGAGYTSEPATFPRLEEGQPIHFETVSSDLLPIRVTNSSMSTVITSSCKNPELAMKYLNYFYTQEGADLANWGIKDKSYTEDASGKKTFTDYMLRNDKIALADAQTMLKIHLTAKLAEADVVCNPNIVSNEESLAIRMRWSDDKTVDDSQVLPGFQLSSEGSTKRNQIMNDIQTYVDEMTLKFITGAAPLTDFDKYLEQLKKMNIEEAIAITQEEYTNFMTKPMPDCVPEGE